MTGKTEQQHGRVWLTLLLATLTGDSLLTGCRPDEPAQAAPPAPAVTVGEMVPPASSPAAIEPAQEQRPTAERTRATSKPARRPLTTTRLATQPASVPTFQPLADASEGEWVVYSAMGGRELRYDVLHAGPGIVVVQVSVREAGLLIGLPAKREELRDLDPLDRQIATDQTERSMHREKITAAGREWEALLYEDQWVDEDDVQHVRRTWVSPQLPVYGTVRMELRGDGQLEATLELKAFGNKPIKP